MNHAAASPHAGFILCVSQKELGFTAKYLVSVVKTKQLAADLVTWVVLIEQWPYRMSYLLEVMDHMHELSSTEAENIVNHDLCDIYE